MDIVYIILIILCVCFVVYKADNKKTKDEPWNEIYPEKHFSKTKNNVEKSKSVTITTNNTQESANIIKNNDENSEPINSEQNINTLEEAVQFLRNRIIEEIKNSPSEKYELASLLWADAAGCFPNSTGFNWDGAWFNLNLNTGKLSAKVSTYPNQFGACREDLIPLTAAEFNRITKKYNMSQELQFFETDEDWAKLFDDCLNTVVSDVCLKLQQEKEEQKRAERLKNAIVIPSEIVNCSPDMSISEIVLELDQRYATSRVKVLQENGHYHVEYTRMSTMTRGIEHYKRELSSSEAVWLEGQVDKALENPDNSTWQSLPGGDRMNIVIKKVQGKEVELRGEPIRKYSDLMHELEKLTQYGSK